MFTQRVIPNSGAGHIGFIWSRVNKTPIRYETKSGDPVSCKWGHSLTIRAPVMAMAMAQWENRALLI